jgi:t-SNARE complex subunit (syntaxin)
LLDEIASEGPGSSSASLDGGKVSLEQAMKRALECQMSSWVVVLFVVVAVLVLVVLLVVVVVVVVVVVARRECCKVRDRGMHMVT